MNINMEIKGFRVTEAVDKVTDRSSILINDVADLSPSGFDLKGTFESGQSFRWHRSESPGSNCGDSPAYSGIVRGKAVRVSIRDGRHLFIENASAEDFDSIWHPYFDLSTDYAPIIRKVDKDDFMKNSVEYSGGVRMLRQDFEETLFSYILSSQNNIPRIMKLVENLCSIYGDKILDTSSGPSHKDFEGYSFPAAGVLANRFCIRDHPGCCSSDLCDNPFGGYRCTYIKKTSRMLASGDVVINADNLAIMSADEARKELCLFPGVGEKVADCVLLYSGIRKDICPIDTWVEKTIRSEYLGADAKKKDIRNFTESYFGSYAGYAQLWFFNYARNR
ncbi:MAG: DNA-3-methyladenine glycosylase family protein [Saccharofermentanales bacterium]